MAAIGAKRRHIEQFSGCSAREATVAHQYAKDNQTVFSIVNDSGVDPWLKGGREMDVYAVLRDAKLRKQFSIAADSIQRFQHLDFPPAHIAYSSYKLYLELAMDTFVSPDEAYLRFDHFAYLINWLKEGKVYTHRCDTCGALHVYPDNAISEEWCWTQYDWAKPSAKKSTNPEHMPAR